VGVYAILNLVTGCAYVAATTDMTLHWEIQRAQLQHGQHPDAALQQAWTRYGAIAFRFIVLEQVACPTHLRAAEQRHLTKRWPSVYNRQAFAA
jgi:hypothetical protein